MPDTTTPDHDARVYRRIKHQLARRLGRQWKPGTRLPPITQLARQLGTGQRNTHLAVRELVEEGLLISRPGLGTLVAPQDSPQRAAASHLAHVGRAGRRLNGVRVMLLSATVSPEEMIVRMMTGAAARLREEGAIVEQRTCHASLIGRLNDLPVDAVMLFNPDRGSGVGCSAEQKLSIVNTGVDGPEVATPNHDVVSVNQEEGGFLIGRHVHRMGYDDVCAIAVARRESRTQPPMLDRTSEGRLRGLERGLGRAIEPDRVLYLRAYDPRAGARAVAAWLRMEPRPRVIVTASDEIAMGFICGAEAHEMQPGHDYHITGFDGQRATRKMRDGPLTTVKVPAEAMGARGAELLAERCIEPGLPVRHVFLDCELEAGRTLRPPEGGRAPR